MSVSRDCAAASFRAAVFAAPGEILLTDTEMDTLGPHEVQVRLEGCGVCASNLPVWEGRSWFQYPFEPGAPGHEGWGKVESIGERVSNYAIGDRVALLSHNAYAQYDRAPADALVKLPDEFADRPFPGEPLACAMNIFRRSEISAGQRVAIVGIGFLGAALTALATNAGAEVIALSRRDFALSLAERMGAAAFVRLDEPARALREFRRRWGEVGCERVIEAVGSQEALDVASELTATRGRLIIAGYHQDGPRTVNLQQWNWRGLDVVNAHERDPAEYRRGMQEAIALVASGRFDPSPLFTHQFALEDISEAFQTLARRPDGFLKALMLCH